MMKSFCHGFRPAGVWPRAFSATAARVVPPALAQNAAELIGNTPMVDLARLCRLEGVEGRILAKVEFFNPGFSKKDRIARQIIEDALDSGALAPGQPVIELTSGNTGTGLAICCGVLGHQFIAVMSAGNSSERARMMRALGAEVHIVAQSEGSGVGTVSGADLELVEQEAQRLTAERGAFRADQFKLAGSTRGHYLYTGPELWSQAAEAGGVHAFVDFVGSAGTFAGVSQFLKEQSSEIKCFLVEPEASAVLAAAAGQGPAVGAQQVPHRIQGGGYSKAFDALPLLDKALVDEYMGVSDEIAILTARRIAACEGLFAGFSSGANVAAALKVLRSDWGRGKTVATVLCDSGLKYLSTDLWAE